jgi:hypothetical protein
MAAKTTAGPSARIMNLFPLARRYHTEAID